MRQDWGAAKEEIFATSPNQDGCRREESVLDFLNREVIRNPDIK
jgi:hypothetical protein